MRLILTVHGRSWFVYLRICGPHDAAFNATGDQTALRLMADTRRANRVAPRPRQHTRRIGVAKLIVPAQYVYQAARCETHPRTADALPAETHPRRFVGVRGKSR